VTAETDKNQEDRNLVQEILKGDEQAFTALLEKYQDLVFSLVYRMLQHYEDARDVSQDVFIKIYSMLPKYKPVGKFYSWLYCLTINLVRDHVRTRSYKRKLKEVAHDREYSSLQYRSLNPHQSFFNKETRSTLETLVASLPQKQREVFILHYFHQISLNEITTITGFSLSNVKVLLHRARKILLQQPKAAQLKEVCHEL